MYIALTGSLDDQQRFPYLVRLDFDLGDISSDLLDSLVQNAPSILSIKLAIGERFQDDAELCCPPLLAFATQLRHFGLTVHSNTVPLPHLLKFLA